MPEETFPIVGYDEHYVRRESVAVDASKLDTGLSHFISSVGLVHFAIFGTPLVITSANDGNHAPHSAHYLNAAVDLRCHDLDASGQIIFGLIMAQHQQAFGVCILDERFTASPHWHVQTAASIGG